MRLQTYLCMVCLFLFGAAALQAQTQYIGPNGGDWFTAANWNNGLPANGNDPLIGGGVSVTIGAPLTIDFSITNFGGIVAEADLTNDGTISNSGSFDVTLTGSLTNNATFNNFGTSTFDGPATFANEAGASFTNGGTFTLNTTFVNRGSVTNNGTIDAAAGTLLTEGNFDNAQVLTTESLTVQNGSTFTNNFGSVLNITGAAAELIVDGNFNNLGSVTADGTFTVNGTFSNSSSVTSNGILSINAGGTFNNAGGTVNTQSGTQNFGTFINGFQLINSGDFNNFGQFNNNNLIENQSGATFSNRSSGTISMGFGSRVANAGTFSNENAFDSFGTIENNGAFDNSGTINSFSGSLVDNNSTFTNSGSISTNDQVLLDGPFTNDGTINVNGGSIWRNASNFTNGLSGTVNVQQDFVNEATGSVTNNGRWTNLVRTRNEGTFVNNALFEILAENLTNAAGATFMNNELLLLLSGNLLNEGTLTNNDLVQSDECSSIKNTSTIDNQSSIVLQAIMFQTGTLTGNPIDCQGCYVHTSTTSDAPSVCQNGTFGADINGDVKVYAGELIAFANFDSCTNIVYLAEGIDRPVFSCSDIGTIITANVVLRTRLGDSLTCTSEITPVDVLEPQFDSCPRDIVIFTPETTATADWTEPTAVDNCTTTSVSQNFSPGDAFPVGITGVTYTFTDDYGNENFCQFRVDVRQTAAGGDCTGDTSAPTFADCPDDISVSTSNQSIAVGWTPPTPQDACYPLTLNTDFAPGQSFGVGNTTVVYTATDGNGNEGTCEFTVTVVFDDPCTVDNVPPSFTNCPANIYQPTNPITGGAVAVWNEPGIFDLCGLASVTASHLSGSVFPAGTTNVTYTAEDNSGNVSTCNFIVTVGANPCVGDLAPPFFANCPSDVNVVTTGNSGVAVWTAPTATSTCNPVTINSNYTPGATFQLGVTTVIYTASDLVGNTSTCSFNVIVENTCQNDAVPPVISNCPADITVAANGTTGTASWTPPTAEDNCQLTTFLSSFQPGASFPIGVTTVIYTAADLNGNIATCEFNVSVVEAPGCTQNASPIEGTTEVDPASVTLSWTTENAADGYDVYLGTSNPPTTQVASNVSGTSTTVTGLQNGVTYYWYVVPVNAAGSATGCESTATSFSTSGNGGGPGGGDCNFEALFVAGSTNLNYSDATVVARLEGLGLTVTVVDDGASTTADADGKGLVIISSTVNSGNVNTKFRDVEVPVIVYESYLYDDMQMVGSGNYGTSGNEAFLSVINSSHPIAAGLNGTVQIFNSYQTVSWGNPPSSATVIANEYGSSYRSLIFAYEAGENMVNLTAPAKRLGFFLHNDSADNLTNDGWKIFDAAIAWATGIQAPGTPCDDGNPNTENDVIQDDYCSCAGTPVCDGEVTGFFFTGDNDVQLFALENGGSYPLNLLPSAYNIEAVTSGTFESALLELNGPVSYSKVENLAPWHLFGTGGAGTLTPGAYTLTVTLYSQDDGVGATCSQTTISFTIEENDPCLTNGPEATAASASANCGQNDGSITFFFPDHPSRTNIEFSIDGGNTYPYNSPDDAGSLTVDNLASGTYYIWVRWGNNECPTNMGIINVGENVNAPTAVCQNISLQLTSIGQSVQISGADVDGGSSAGCGTITSLNASPTSFAQPGTYTVTLTVTNSFGLSANCTATVTVLAPCTVNGIVCEAYVDNGGWQNLNDCTLTVCEGSSVYLSVNPNGLPSYHWTGPNGYSAAGNAGGDAFISDNITAADAGTYHVVLTQADGCQGSTSIEVIVENCNPNPTICKGPAGTGLTREVWEGIGGVLVSDLTQNANYPDNPSYSTVNAGSTGPSNIADNYGTRVRGFITPTYSGNYTFYVTGDDYTQLYLSTDDNPDNASLIAYIDGWTNPDEYYKYGSQKSVTISLTTGQDYYVELLHKEGGGGDHWGIHWTSGSGHPYPISLDQLSPIRDCNTTCNTDVLFVVGNTSLNSGDAWVNSRLATLGYSVELVDDDHVQTEDANGKGLVVISSTVSSGKVGSKFTHSSVPVVTWEPYIYDDMKMTGYINFGSNSGQYKLDIKEPGHPLAAGLSGEIQVYTYLNSMNWGQPDIWGNDAINVAELDWSSKSGVLGYEAGENMHNGFDAPARRVGLFLNNTSATILNSNGVALFDAAIHWASACGENFAGEGLGDRSSSLDLAAAKNDFDVQLVWQSNTADLDKLFIIERSADGENWEPIMTIDSKVSDDENAIYRTFDEQPLTGKNLYRVIGDRADGSTINSGIAEVVFAELEAYAVFPNPARDQIYVDLSQVAGKEVLVRLFDAKGVTVDQWEVIATDEPMLFELDQKQSGQYMLWMYVDDRRPVTRRLILERN